MTGGWRVLARVGSVFGVVMAIVVVSRRATANDDSDRGGVARTRTLSSSSLSLLPQASDRIVNGNVTEPGAYPFFAHLLVRSPYNGGISRERLCGGTLIGPEWILTASHCLLDANDKRQALSTLYGFEVGFYCRRGNFHSPMTHDEEEWLSDNCGVASHQVAISQVFLPRAFNASRWYYYDVAWVKLARPLENWPYAIPDNGRVLESLHSGAQAARLRALGRGAKANDVTSDYLEAVDMPLLNTTRCEELWGKEPGTFRNIFCLQTVQGAATCAGDSGGPVLWSSRSSPHFVRGGHRDNDSTSAKPTPGTEVVVVGVNSGGRFETGPSCVRATVPNLYGQVSAFYPEIYATVCTSSSNTNTALAPSWCKDNPPHTDPPPSIPFLINGLNCQMGKLPKERFALFRRNDRKPTLLAKKCRWLRRQSADRIDKYCSSPHSNARQQCPQTCWDEQESVRFAIHPASLKSCRWLRRQTPDKIRQLCFQTNKDNRTSDSDEAAAALEVCPQTCHVCGGGASQDDHDNDEDEEDEKEKGNDGN